ncbi:MAG TPA: TasA family protein [Candidatus Paceibacterota bacterium]|nr:TasA family protein [Candidatus Pacearchaeota archaeon]HRZ50843.1 TasA family protein [Candidatus Paceibacterota bacterium]HSA36564.1 TasA family protein [Candidatus Paceibacterota bacterium]
MKKILLAIFFLSITLALTTAAFLSDRETFENNAVTAGTLDLTLNETTTGADIIENRLWVPGDEIEATVLLKNNGTLPIGSITMQAKTEEQN